MKYRVEFGLEGTRSATPPLVKDDLMAVIVGNMVWRLINHGYVFGDNTYTRLQVQRPIFGNPATYTIDISVNYPNGSPIPPGRAPEKMLADCRAELEASGWLVGKTMVSQELTT
jgi:hypothetical protein